MAERPSVTSHYARDDLAEALIAVLERSGRKRERLTADDLHLVDQFHLRGRIAAEEFLDRLDIAAGERVLDVGCGIGGPARLAAARYGARVSGIDLTAEFCACAERLNAFVGLADRIEIRQGDALAMPYEDACFDVVFTQHVAMNIFEKPALYREIARVLRPGGRFGLYDIVEGSGEPVHMPVPWASDPAHSHLASAERVLEAVVAAGFEPVVWEDLSETVAEFMDRQRDARARRAAAGEPEPPNGAEVLMGPDAALKQKNIYRNLKEGRIAVRLGIFRLGH